MDMPFLKLLFYHLLLTSFNLASSEVDIPAYYDHNCTINKNFTSNSPYQFNLNTLLASLYTTATGAGSKANPEFFNTTVGSPNTNETVYGEYMCRGDVPSQVCRDCVQDAASRIVSECPHNKEAIIWYDQCFLRYSHRSFFSTLYQQPTVNGMESENRSRMGSENRSWMQSESQGGTHGMVGNGHGPGNSDDANSYEEFNTMLNETAVEAATSSGTKKFSTKEANLSSWGSVYTLVQCTPDLPSQLCSECLHGMIELIPTPHSGMRGRILNPSCNLRLDTERFYYKGNQPPSDVSSTQALGSPTLTDWDCSPTDTWSAKDPYPNNLKSLTRQLFKLSNNTKNNGFYKISIGNKSDTVYGLFMCRGDVPLKLCNECIVEGIVKLNDTCPSSKEAIIWYDKCMLRYSNRSFFSTLDTQPIYAVTGGYTLGTQTEGFNRLLANTLNSLVAATLNSSPHAGVKNFATKTEFSSSELTTLYTLAQCTPILSSQDCEKCLGVALQNITSCCLERKGGQVMNPSCNLRFESYRFYNDSKSDASVPPAYPPNTSVGSEGATLESLQFNLATIEAATDKFSIENRIGKGGFGEVYMGILPDGSKIAVKRLSENSSQGLLEFKNEVLLIARLQHRNLVALLGFCLKDQEKILIYEYVPNKSLDYFLFGSQKSRVLNWLERYKIIEGIARGILYLHEHSRLKVIHRDLKPSNILLDDEMNPKISDFGMARMVGINETRGNTNRIVGTLGYMSPEYIKFGLFSEKSDVYSFGVIVLEIVSGKNIHSQCESHESQYTGGLLSDAWKHWRDERLTAILDSNLTEAGSHGEIIKCIHIGLLCVQGNPGARPSMNKVVQYLNNDSMQLPIPQEPAFFIHSQMEPAATSREMEARLGNHNQYSINEMSESIISPR
ncbi:cysteine-rich receptor-like protein kinase 10 [Neltuma alba]|uniref:cysteine-rich receptor-like protein kinase 10 n=1 Tax=Neltuma alba TaxID=207710 RepID=UPI0010A56386|nr:cysteine-rich receptor-like protein kinase 10 [Prosopis alba]